MIHKVSFIHHWHPTTGTHYGQQIRIAASRKELEDRNVHLQDGINYVDHYAFLDLLIRLGINADPRISCGHNTVFKYEPTD